MVLKLSFPVILIDELLKFVARTYLEGKLDMRPVHNMLPFHQYEAHRVCKNIHIFGTDVVRSEIK